MVKSETSKGIFVMDVKGAFPGEPKVKVSTPAFANTLSPIILVSYHAHTIHMASTSLRASLVSKHMQAFHVHREEEYESFCRN